MQPLNASKNDNNNLETIIVVVIGAIALGISLVQTSKGYKDLFGGYLSISVAIVIVLGMLLFNIRLRRNIKESGGIGKRAGIWFMLLLFTFMSFLGNFNSFYYYFRKDDLLKKELEQKRDKLFELQEDAKRVLTDTIVIELRSKIDNLKNQHTKQISNKADSGHGAKAELILKDIEKELGSITRLKGRLDPDTLAKRYEEMINNAMETKIRAFRKTPEKQSLLIEINTEIERLTPIIREELTEDKPTTLKMLNILRDIVEVYKREGVKCKNLSEGTGFAYDDKMKVENAEVGKIDHALSSAKQNLWNTGTMVAIFLSIFIDLILPIMITILTKTQIDKPQNIGRFKPLPKN